MYFLVPGSMLAVLPLAFCFADGQPGHKGGIYGRSGLRALDKEEKGDLSIEREAR